jgi:Peptidase family S41
MRRLPFFLMVFFLYSCSATRNYQPNKKFAPQKLQQDYSLLREILEKKHPSLYWYTPVDSMNQYFDEGYKAITDSMTELQFGWKILAPLTAHIHCGHTGFAMSKGWNKFIRDKTIPSFPLFLKVWKDTMMVIGNLNAKDSVIKPGVFITSINGVRNAEMINTMFHSMSEDGYANGVNYIRLSGNFPYFHRNIFGLYKQYYVTYTDSSQVEKTAVVPLFSVPADSLKAIKRERKQQPKLSRGERLERIRSLQYDSTFALMTVNEFSKGHLTAFFKRSFRQLRKNKTQNLVIDLRTNGGGDINKSVLLTKFLINTSFKVADSVFSVSKNLSPFTRHISSGFFDNLGLLFVTRKRKDGNYHFGYWTRHVFLPKRKNHFDGKVFVLTNGLTFSASSLFCNALKGQSNVTLAGEETGGGWYGNSGIMIPYITLPNTRLRVRLPFFRLVQYEHIVTKGTGVIPDVYIGPNVSDILQGRDTKLEAVKKIIAQQ